MFGWDDLIKMSPGLASIGGGMFNMLGKKKNPADAANRELDKIPGQVSPYYQPYIDKGKSAMDALSGQYGDMTNDPNAFYNKIAGGYKESPGYQYKLQQALTAGSNAAAAGGMLGTPMNQEQNMGIAEGLANKDFEDYLQNVLGIFGQGQKGMEGQQQMGFDASKGYGDILGQIGGQKAAYNFAGQAGQNQSNAANWGNIFGGLGSLGQYFSNNRNNGGY